MRDAYIVDVDGTLALMNGRSPYDPTKYHTDLPNKPVIDVVSALVYGDYAYPAEWRLPALIVVSGRDDTYRDVTLSWLRSQGLDPQLLLMRPMAWETDPRHKTNDAVVKERLYHEYIEPHYNVLGVFDDRDRVVKMWRSLGLTCFQVAEGNF